MGHIDVIVTTFEKAQSVEQCLRRLIASLDLTSHAYRILVVDDGSSDDTVERARSVEDSRITVMSSVHNEGKGAQIKRATAQTNGVLVAIFDGDLDIHPRSLVRGIDALKQSGAVGVVGSKPHKDSEINYPTTRRLLSLGFRMLVRVMFGLNVRDTQTGVKVFQGEELRAVVPSVLENGFLFDLELLARMSRRGHSIIETPVEIDFDFTSTVTPNAILQMGIGVFGVFRNLRQSKR